MTLLGKLALFGGAALALLVVAAGAALAYIAWAVETPDYRVVAADGPFEIRDYPAMRAAEVETTGPRQEAVRAGFRPLAGYIFARDREGPSIAMTAPVTQTPSVDAGAPERAWVVRFLMPSGYALADLPRPADADLRLIEIPARRVAAVRFSGAWTDARFAAQEDKLRAWVAAQGGRGVSAATFAYYNDPFTPSFLRRNEVLIDVDMAPPASPPDQR